METAARISEVLALRVGDVTVTPEAGVLVLGRGGRSKTGTERRALISPALVDAMDLDREPDAWLFPSRRGPEKAIAYGTFRTIVVAWLRAEGLYRKRDIHSLRRRGAAELHRAEIPTEIGRRVTGHEDSSVFLSYASKGRFDLTDASRILWVDASHMGTTGGSPPTSSDSGGADLDVLGHAGKCEKLGSPSGSRAYVANPVPLVWDALRKSAPVPGLARLLRLSCSGVQG